MNTKLLIIGGAALMLMVAFGRNPIEEARKEQLKKTQGKDALITAIEEHNAKRSPGVRGGGPLGAFNASPNGGSNGSFGIGSGAMRPPNYPSYMYGSQNRSTGGNRAYAPETVVGPDGQPIYGQDGQVLDQTKQGYYPPPPLPGTNPQQQYRRLPPRSEMNFKLPNGQPLAFRDTDVYTVDATGKTVPMPDGVYPIYEGRANLVISGGKSIITNN